MDDTSLKTIYWVGTQTGQLMDLPEMGRYTWREYVLICVKSAYVCVMGFSDFKPVPTSIMDPDTEPAPSAMELKPATRAVPELVPSAQSILEPRADYCLISGWWIQFLP